MKKKVRNLTAGIMLGAASLIPMKNANAQNINIDGWLEASLGKPTANLRLYPRVSAGNFNLQSLIDINGYYSFTKTDLFHKKLKTKKFGGGIVRPVLTLYTNPDKKRLMPGLNVSYEGPFRSFGFAELGIDLTDIINGSTLYTYNGVILPKNIGRIGLFTVNPINDFKSRYVELEITGPDYKGIAPYARANFVKGQKPTWQAGISITPKKFFNRGSKGGK